MPDESTTPDLVELTRQAFDAASSGDFDALMQFYTPDAVWDLSDLGLGIYDGVAAIRGFHEDWFGAYDDHSFELDEILDLGHGVVFVAYREEGRPMGGKGRVEQRRWQVSVVVGGKAEWVKSFADIDEARADAERLAESRG
jgi:ketosteroid isomerase-like protein